jgi:hypothetical protein
MRGVTMNRKAMVVAASVALYSLVLLVIFLAILSALKVTG